MTINFYQKKFEQLNQDFDQFQAINKVVELLLFQKHAKFSQSEKYSEFWQADFIKTLDRQVLVNEFYILALSYYLRFSTVDSDTCQQLLAKNPIVFILACRQSGIIAQDNHPTWLKLQQLSYLPPEFNEFIQVVDTLHKRQYTIQTEFNQIKSNLTLDKIEAMIFSSLYAYEYLVGRDDSVLTIPYKVDPTTHVAIDNIWQAFDQIFNTFGLSKNPLTEKMLANTLKKTLIPFLFPKGLNDNLVKNYEQFKKLVALKIENNEMDNFVWQSYCYDLHNEYYLDNQTIKIKRSTAIKDIKTDSAEVFNQKFTIIHGYWWWRGMEIVCEHPRFLQLDRGENFLENMDALAKSIGIQLQLQEVYGIQEIDFNQDFTLDNLIFSMVLSQAFYQKSFLDKFIQHQKQTASHPFNTLAELMLKGMITGENRLPVTFNTFKEKSIKMANWISEGSGNAKKRQMEKILKFWSMNLRESGDNASYVEKPFYQIDEYIFQLPYRVARQTIFTASIQIFRKLYKNRPNLNHETARMEQQLATLFDNYGFGIVAQFEPHTGQTGEIDLIVYDEHTVLLIELKSTYLRSSLKEIHEYKNVTLNKASYQLSKKLDYVKNNLSQIIDNNIISPNFYTWIVDTTLEFDHQIIKGSLKLSFEELIIVLNGHNKFLDFVSGQQEEFTPAERFTTLKDLVSYIENNQFWQTTLSKLEETTRGQHRIRATLYAK